MRYQLHCPNCTTLIPPDQINVQKTIAVCPACGAVFNFADDVSTKQKVKRRKAKQPDHINQTEIGDNLTLEMPLLHTTGSRIGMGAASLGLFVLYLLIIAAVLNETPPDTTAAVVFSVMFIPMILAFFSSLFMRQKIEVNTHDLKHSIRLGISLYQRVINTDDITDVSAEETTSTRESVAAARYNLFADKYDGRQEMFMQNLPEDTALYAQQVLSNYLRPDDTMGECLRIQNDEDHTDSVTAYATEERAMMKQTRSGDSPRLAQND